MKLKSIVSNPYIRILVSLTLITFLIYKMDFTQSLSILYKSNLMWVFAAILAMVGNVVVSSWRLKYILSIFKLKKSLDYLADLYLIGNFYNNFLPTQMGGDIYKAYKLSKDLKKSGEGTFTIFMDRFSGLVVLFIVGLFGLFIRFGMLGFIISIILFVVGLYSYSFVLNHFSKKIKFVAKFKKANDVFLSHKNKAISVFLTAMVVQIFAIASQLFAFYAVGVDIPIWSALLYFPLITLLGLIPSINGIGVQDSAFIFFFGTLGILGEQAFAASILYHLMRFSFSLLGGALLLIGSNRSFKNNVS